MDRIFSEQWTDEDRLKLILFLAGRIQQDIPAGRYGAVTQVDAKGIPLAFRPNMQSIIEVALASAEQLEETREEIEAFIRKELSHNEVEDFRVPLGKARRMFQEGP